mmetsp:Transcript_48386/g.115144  ORF Transcript_48386/g.115144 Transcript_48386/m.115144 type:complete len:330 (+) Transcript_48386:224-1213(+)
MQEPLSKDEPHSSLSPASARSELPGGCTADRDRDAGIDEADGESGPSVPCWAVHRWQRATQVRLFLLVCLIGGLVALLTALPTWEYLRIFAKWCEENQAVGAIILIGFYIIATLLAFPASVLTIVGGFIFGVWIGSAAVLTGATLGACLAFLCGRYLFRDAVNNAVATRYPRIRLVFGVIAKQGFKITFLLRLSPIVPFNALNYALGITEMSFLHYAVATLTGMIPGTILYCYIGSTVKSIGDIASGNMEQTPEQQIFFWCGLVASIIVTVGISFYARREMQQALAAENPGDEQAAPLSDADAAPVQNGSNADGSPALACAPDSPPRIP